ncbi:MAG: DNA polymerase III subunit delta [Gemmatimonadota bacterium]|nr:MAG: DNA polymerase III subunit delta [Gemmatimonadota bacterium]
MRELTYDQLVARLAKGKLGGSYFLNSDEPFLRDQAIKLLIEAHLGDGSADFDLDQMSGDDADPAKLAALLATPPLLSSYRVTVVREAQSLAPKARSVVEDAVRQPVSNRVVIVAAQVPRGSKARFYQILREQCVSLSLRAPGSSELAGWLAKQAKAAHGIEMDMSAAQLLASVIGARLGVLAQELDKLASGAGADKRIGLGEVRAAAGALPQVNRWEWIDRVAERRISPALVELPDLLDSGESAVGLIGALSEALIRVGLAGEGEGALVAVLKRDGSYGNLSWKLRAYRQQARNWDRADLAAALAELLRADRLIKSGGLSERAALEEALLRIGTLGRAEPGAGRILGRGRTGGKDGVPQPARLQAADCGALGGAGAAGAE